MSQAYSPQPPRSTSLRQVRRQGLGRAVAEELMGAIRRREFAPEEKLPAEHVLMKLLGVGRSTVREALNGLALAGLVEVRHGQGYYVAREPDVAPLDLELALRRGFTVELMEARLLVEPEMAALAAERATPEELRDLEASLESYQGAVNHHRPTPRLGHRFHELILEAAHNDVLMGFVRSYTAKVIDRGNELERVEAKASLKELREHRAIFEAVRAQDPGLARSRSLEHLRSVRSDYISVEERTGVG